MDGSLDLPKRCTYIHGASNAQSSEVSSKIKSFTLDNEMLLYIKIAAALGIIESSEFFS